jgi:glutamate-1-semialdehyde 2,1-aminomutase
MAQAPATHSIQSDYQEQFAKSHALSDRANQAIAGGIAHDGRFTRPFPVYVTHADGAHKWDVDGHELIDFAMGHGALILGHNDPDVAAAVTAQYPKGTHYGACHEIEIEWAEQIQRLMPSAERVRFTSSGTESTLLAARLARAYTGRDQIVKFEGHFHGWNDYLIKGEKTPFDAPHIPGVPDATLGTVTVLPANDAALVEERLSKGDVAAVIIEPSGASWSTIPLVEGFLANLRDITTKHDVVLIFDEVITGFRWAPGGAQGRFSVVPDMTTMAKIVAGGLSGGAVAGKAGIMAHLEFRDDPNWMKTKKVIHPGTYNANPLAAAAGVATLKKCANPDVQLHCDRLASKIRAGMNAALVHNEIPGAVWGESSAFHIYVGGKITNRTSGDLRTPEGVSAAELKSSGGAPLSGQLKLGMLLEGVDLFAGGGLLSIAHTDQDADKAIAAFDRVLQRFVNDGIVE